MDVIKRIQDWYLLECNGDWEHTYGISINTLDNPGWALKVIVKDTYLYDIEFPKTKIQREDEDDWVHCKVEKGEFLGFGGPKNLHEMLEIFLDWADKHKSC